MNKQRLLVIGAGGFLGTYAVRAAEAAGCFDVIRGGRAAVSESTSELEAERGMEAVDLHIADPASVDRAFEQAHPDAVLLLAAISDIDRCERLPHEAFAANVQGPEHVANTCARCKARLLFTSSAAVFDGTQEAYSEEDMPNPLSAYGKTKLLGEKAIQERLPSAVILRFALVIGFARKSGTNAMLDRAIAHWKAQKRVSFPTHEDRNPIDAATLAEIMIALIADPNLSGLYHAGASDSVSRYELGLRLAARAGVPVELVSAQNEPVAGRAPRGQHHFLPPHKLSKALHLHPQSTNEAIERCFA